MYTINIRANRVKLVEGEKNESFVDEFKKLQETNLYKDNHEGTWYCDGTIVIYQFMTADGIENLMVGSMCPIDIYDLMNILKVDSVIHEELQSLVKIVESRVNNGKYSRYWGAPEEFFSFNQRTKCRKCQPSVDPYI